MRRISMNGTSMGARGLWLSLAWLSASPALGCGRREALPVSQDRGPEPPAQPAQLAQPAQPEAPTAPLQESRIERDGLSIVFALRPLDRGQQGGGSGLGAAPAAAGPAEAVAGSDVVAEFTITDASTGAPARGLAPLGWMSRRAGADGGASAASFSAGAPAASLASGASAASLASGAVGAAPDEAACREKIKSFKAGLLSVRPEVDMNAYLLWTLNQDNTLSAINPQVALAKTQLRSVVSLAGPGVSFVLHPDRESLYVTLRGGHGLAVVDTRRGLVRVNVPVGQDPSRVVVAPDGRTVWVGNDGDGTVSVIDARSTDVLKTLQVGPGHHEIAFTGGGRAAWITSQRGESVTVVDGGTLEPLGDIAVGEGVVSIAASDEAGVVHAANAARGEVVILDAARRAVTGRVALKPGLGALQFEPRGRFSFALNPAANEAAVLDGATGAVAHALTGLAAPDAVTFTGAFAYIRNQGAPRVSLVDRAALGGPAALPLVDVTVGQSAPLAAAARPGQTALATPIAPLPEGNGALVASPADRALYVYVEGMMAPIGTLPSYGREPRSILVEDRSLKEVRPGVYATTVRLGEGGVYDVELLLDRPRTGVCLEATVAPARCAPGDADASGCGADPAKDIAFTPLFEPDLRLTAGEPATLRFRATAAEGGPPLDALAAEDIEVMVVRFPAGYRFRGVPRAEGDGTFSVAFTPPVPGQYRFLAAVPARGAPVGVLPFVPLRVSPRRAGADGGGAR
ncbi:YncE family protein [Sorangium sp. So ce1000]|uniref:YncE family protein n=1 Tax=Sorangium sp. So ce1000 TaxID=3133325 RepID=UPI003F5DB084